MATLRGHAIATLGGAADHTYVTCDGGYAWPCWGRSAGGAVICSGTGSSNRANCISQPNSWAGIVYGVTGVCHQTSNRILQPAGVTVRAAKGYWASWFVYGTYGTDTAAWLIRLAICSRQSGEMAQCATRGGRQEDEGGGSRVRVNRDDRALVRELMRLYRTGVSPTEHRRRATLRGPDVKNLGREAKLVLKQQLGSNYTAERAAKVIDVQKKLHGEAAKVQEALYGGMSGADFAKEMNDVINRNLKRAGRALGKRNYVQLMGADPGEEIIIVDPKIAAEAHG